MENIILVSGCSFTEEDSIATWAKNTKIENQYKIKKVWPDYISKNINLGRSGFGNDEAIWSVIYFLEKNNIKNISKVFIALTDWSRFMIPDKIAVRMDLATQISPDKMEEWNEAKEKFYGKKYKYIEGYQNAFGWNLQSKKNIIDYNFQHIYTLAQTCEIKKIPLYVFQMLPMFHLYYNETKEIGSYFKKFTQSSFFKNLLNFKYFNYIDWKETFHNKLRPASGHKFTVYLYGSSINEKLYKYSSKMLKDCDDLRWGYPPIDEHPIESFKTQAFDAHLNAAGHKWVGNYIRSRI
jgi:hypothetical protein